MSSSERDISSGDHSTDDPDFRWVDGERPGPSSRPDFVPIVRTRSGRGNGSLLEGLGDSHEEVFEEISSSIPSSPGGESDGEAEELIGFRIRRPNLSAHAGYLQVGGADPVDNEATDRDWINQSDDEGFGYDVNSGEEFDYESDESK